MLWLTCDADVGQKAAGVARGNLEQRPSGQWFGVTVYRDPLPLKEIEYFIILHGYHSKGVWKRTRVKPDAAIKPLPSQASLGHVFIVDFVIVTEPLESVL